MSEPFDGDSMTGSSGDAAGSGSSGGAAVPGPFGDEGTSGPSGGDGMSYEAPDDLRAVRVFVTERALALGMSEARIDLLTLAVSELTTNTLQHTTGGGHIRLFVDGGRLVCDVVDRGAERPFGRAMPSAEAVGGRGLAIVERICDDVYTTTVPGGTLVRICLDL
ncbi:ATP-binding protein [Actinoplanes sp. DH11]|uniref:ATP-binding protein n=1 Tax=Actinoplanes sp. DH11 TaxID=2857011 RepID=UPI001E6392FE|nr:ATP-binding protein [Actinoplanes sp. DH11]